MRKSLLFSAILSLIAVFGVKAQSWQYELTKADGLPGKNKGMYYQMTTPVYSLDEATNVIRLTCFSTTNVDGNAGKTTANGYSNNASYFPTFTIAELRLFDGEGNPVELTADMFTTNALSLDEGSLDAMVDGDLNTFFHSTYSNGEVPQAYHYVEIALTDPMDKFQLQWDTRYYYYYPDPTHVGITPGTEALPWNNENFVLGEQVTSIDALQPNTLYALRGNYFEFTRTENQRTLPSRGDTYYHSPHGAAITPSAASLLWLEDAGDGQYHMRWLKCDHYLSAPTETLEAGEYSGWTTDVVAAAPLAFSECDSVDGAFEIKSGNKYLGQRRFVRMSWVNDANMVAETSTYHYAWNVYETSVSNAATMPLLQAAIDRAEELMKIQGVAGDDEGEHAALQTAVAAAKTTISEATASANEVLQESAALYELINSYRITYIWVLCDSIETIINEAEFCGSGDGWVAGGYPESYQDVLQGLMDEGGQVADNPVNSTVVENCISEICATLDNFYASKIENVTEFPIHIEDEKDGLTASEQVNNSWIWTSPVYYLSEATDVIRMTVFKNSSGETESGTPFFALGEFILYDEAGNQIELREDMITTNSIQTNDGEGLAAIVDGDNSTFYHGCYSPDETNNSYAPAEGVYAFIEFALDESVSAFSVKTVSRNNSSDYYKHTPLEYAFTPGTTITYEDVLGEDVDKYPTVRGEQITDVSQIEAGELYLLWGNLMVVTTGSDSLSTYYNSNFNANGKEPNSVCVVTFDDAGDGQYYMRYISNATYLKKPAGWEGASGTYNSEEACPLTIMKSTNLENSFKIYWEGVVTDAGEDTYGQERIFVMQAWESNIGMFTIANWESDDKDGESDWYIYKAEVENAEQLELAATIEAFESLGLDYSNVGDAVGMFTSASITPVVEAYAKAVAALESNDPVACETAETELRTILGSISSIETIPMVDGQDYIIRSANKEFKPFHGEDCKLSMFVGPANGSGARDSENMLWFTYEYVDGLDSTAYHFTFVQDTTYNDGEETWPKYTIKNVLYDEYIQPEFPNGKNITTQPFSSPDAAPLIYMRPNGTAQYTFVGVEAWHQESYPSYCYFETRTGGGPYGTSGEAHYGRVATWSWSANTAQWRIIPVSNETSIGDIVVDEPAGEVVSVSYYTPDGVASNVPVKGVCIVKKVYANGVIETKKTFVK